MTVTFSINMYDYEGDIYNECILLHINDNVILKVERNGLREFIDQLERIDKEIKENY